MVVGYISHTRKWCEREVGRDGMERHRIMMFVGGFLLLATFLIDMEYSQNAVQSDEFNYAYVTGGVMIGVFLYSFYLFYSKNERRR